MGGEKGGDLRINHNCIIFLLKFVTYNDRIQLNAVIWRTVPGIFQVYIPLQCKGRFLKAPPEYMILRISLLRQFIHFRKVRSFVELRSNHYDELLSDDCRNLNNEI